MVKNVVMNTPTSTRLLGLLHCLRTGGCILCVIRVVQMAGKYSCVDFIEDRTRCLSRDAIDPCLSTAQQLFKNAERCYSVRCNEDTGKI